jgi:hypothetical protein
MGVYSRLPGRGLLHGRFANGGNTGAGDPASLRSQGNREEASRPGSRLVTHERCSENMACSLFGPNRACARLLSSIGVAAERRVQRKQRRDSRAARARYATLARGDAPTQPYVSDLRTPSNPPPRAFSRSLEPETSEFVPCRPDPARPKIESRGFRDLAPAAPHPPLFPFPAAPRFVQFTLLDLLHAGCAPVKL